MTQSGARLYRMPEPARPAETVPARRKRRLRFRPKPGIFFIVPLIITASLAFNLVGMVGLRIRLAREAGALEREAARLKELKARLEQEVAYRESDEYIEDQARKYGLAPKDEVQYRFAITGEDGEAPVRRVRTPEIGD